MSVIIYDELSKRDWNDGNGGRWAFFVFVIALIVILFAMVCYTNIKRIKRGRAPIRGTNWITPPSYYQSQNVYQTSTSNQLPVYTANPNPNQDAGFYDKDGIFVPYDSFNMNENTENNAPDQQVPYQGNQNAYEQRMPGEYVTGNNNDNLNSPFVDQDDHIISYPPQSHLRNASYVTPGGRNTAGNDTNVGSSNSEEEDLPGYTAPPGPPPKTNTK
ncbi:hypothetical protein BVG19_g1830 [[Candida] boidinii]|nr:hypothetical protein BVG19_g1830 [[Candida] boidinii]OWB54001.1 hypothetical protein B5S27_g5621 [[Candida] boidinii]